MAEEVTYTPISDANVANILAKGSAVASSASIGIPTPTSEQLKEIADSSPENVKYILLSDDPNGPRMAVPKDATKEEVQSYLKNPKLEQNLFNKGYIYKYGIGAERYDNPNDLDDTAFTKGLKGGWAGLKQIGMGAVGTVADILGMEDLEKATNDAIQRYQIQGMADQFIRTKDGEIIPFEASIEKILTEEDRVAHFFDWLGFNVGQGLVTTIPIFAASMVNPVLGVGAAYGMGVGDSRIAQLEATDFEKANAGLSLAIGVPYAVAERLLGAGSILQKMLYQKFGKEATREGIDKLIKQSTSKTIGKETGKSIAGESLAEGTQEALVESAGAIEKALNTDQEIIASLSDLYTDKDFYKKIGEAAGAGAAGGGPFGIVGGAVKSYQISDIKNLDAKDSRAYQDNRTNDDKDPVVINKLGEDYTTNTYTVTGISSSKDIDDNDIVDEDGNIITPKFQVIGTYDRGGKRKVFLKDLTPGAKNTFIERDIDVLDNLNIVQKPTEDKKADTVDPQTGEVEETPVFDKREDYEKINVKPLTNKKREKFMNILRGRGYTDSQIELIEAQGPRALAYEVENGTNYLTPEEIQQLGQLGYLQEIEGEFSLEVPRGGPRAIYTPATLKEIQENISVNKKTGKTAGREILEEIINNKVQNTPRTSPIKEQVGTTPAVPPTPQEEIVNQADEKLAKEISKVSEQLRNPKLTEEKRQELINYRDILDKASGDTMRQDAQNRYRDMQILANRIGQEKHTPAAIEGYKKAIEGLRKRKGITEEDRTTEINRFQSLINRAEADLRDFNILYSSFGYKPLTRQQLNRITQKSFPNKGKIRALYQGTREKPIMKQMEVWSVDDSTTRTQNQLRQEITDNKIKALDNGTYWGTVGHTFWNTGAGSIPGGTLDSGKSAFLYLKPSVFLRLATTGADTSQERQTQLQEQYGKNAQNGITPPYLFIKLTYTPEGTPVLSIVGHEGRHRALYASRLNPDKPIPVQIQISDENRKAVFYDTTIPGYKGRRNYGDFVGIIQRAVIENQDMVIENEAGNPEILTNLDLDIDGFVYNNGEVKLGRIFKRDDDYNPDQLANNINDLGVVAYLETQEQKAQFTKEAEQDLMRIYVAMRAELDKMGLDYVNLSILNRWLDNSKSRLGKFIGTYDTAAEAMNFQNPQVIEVLGKKYDNLSYESRLNTLMVTLRHEAMHAMFRSGLFTDKELNMLKEFSKKHWVDAFNVRRNYSGLPGMTEEVIIEEGITAAFGAYLNKKYIPKGRLAQVFERLKAFFLGLSRALFKTGYTNPAQLFEAIDNGEFKRRMEERKRLILNNTVANNTQQTLEKRGPSTRVRQRRTPSVTITDIPEAQPGFNYGQEYIDEPSSPEIDEYIPGTRQNLRSTTRQMENDIARESRADETNTASPETIGTFNRVFSHARAWAKKYPVFEKLFSAVSLRDQKSRELQSQFVATLSKKFMKVMRNPEYSKLINKALEISQQVKGRYRMNENGQIIFRAQRNGDGADSTVKAGEVVVLEGDLAEAYENVQEAVQMMHKEIVRGLLANDSATDLLSDTIQTLISLNALDVDAKTFLNNTKSITELTENDYENLSYTDLLQLTNAVKDFKEAVGDNAEILINLQLNAKEGQGVIARLNTLLGQADKEGAPGTGLLALTSELKKYDDFTKTDYVPLQRYGSHYIVVKDKDGKTIDYRMFDKVRFGLIKQDEEKEVREALQNKYGGNPDVTISETKPVTISDLRRDVQADLNTIDAAAQFLSDTNKAKYNEIRKEIETTLNKGTDITNGVVQGYSAFIQPRKQEGGIPGYSTDFARGLTQYGLASSNFAAGNRFNKTIADAYRGTQDPKQADVSLRDASKKWYEYVMDPKQELAQIRRLGFWYYLGGNISSAFLQLMSIVQFSGPILSTISGKKQSSAVELVKAFNDVRKMLVFNGRKFEDVFLNFDKLPEDVREDALADIYNGTIKQGMAAHEAGMPLGGGVISQNQTRQRALRTFENTVIGGVFNTFETIARLTAYIAAHRMMQKPDAMDNAVNFFNTDADFRGNVDRNGGVATPRMVAQQVLEETFGVYGKLNRPQYMRGWGSAFFLFQTYISQMFSLMTRMLTRQGTPAQKAAGRKALAKMLIMIAVTGGFFGMPGVDDALWFKDLITRLVTGVDKDTRSEFRNMIAEVSGPKVAEFFENGIINTLANVDVQRRLSFGNVPGSGQIRALLSMMGLNTGARAEEFLGAPGAILFQNARNVVGAYEATGKFPIKELAYAVTPTFITNLLKAGDIVEDGRVESRYGTILTEDATLYDAFLQGLGFSPTKISKERELLRLERLNSGRNSQVQARMNRRVTTAYRKIFLGMIKKDFESQLEGQEDLKELLIEIFAYNSNQDWTNQLNIDVQRLAMEAMKDLSKEYRVLKGGSTNIELNLKDAEGLGIGYDFPSPNPQ